MLSRQAVPALDRARCASAEGVRRGAHVLADAREGKPQLILIASGSEVGLIVAAQRLQEGIAVRSVSMPSWDLFDALSKGKRDAVLPPSVRARLAVEVGATQGWHRYVGDAGDVLGIDRFGASAPGETPCCANTGSPWIMSMRARRLCRPDALAFRRSHSLWPPDLK